MILAVATCFSSLRNYNLVRVAQVSAMLSIMSRYKWRQLGILTSEIAGHDDFVQAVRDQITAAKANGRYTVWLYISVHSSFLFLC